MKDLYYILIFTVLFVFLWNIIDWIRLGLLWTDEIWTAHIYWALVWYYFITKSKW